MKPLKLCSLVFLHLLVTGNIVLHMKGCVEVLDMGQMTVFPSKLYRSKHLTELTSHCNNSDATIHCFLHYPEPKLKNMMMLVKCALLLRYHLYQKF